ncbi:MAG TPA: putative Ig domain-containing protein [Gaiellaceae bacterium]|nr:putative Ig domain-containing protein [Gaiellaceae bacterium]
MRVSVRAAAVCVALAALCAAGALAAVASARAGGPLPKVTFIGDSEATGLLDWKDAVATASQGVSFDFELAPCRRLVAPSCPYGGVRPPTLVELVSEPSFHLAPTVVVAVGYNDYADRFAADLEQSIQALDKAGAKRIVWVNLRLVKEQYLSMDDDILAAAARHPELTVADWDAYSNGKDWFQPDGVHFGAGGAQGYAAFLHQTLVDLGIAAAPAAATTTTTSAPPEPLRIATRVLPPFRKGVRSSDRLTAAGGTLPYYWSFPKHPPAGLHVGATGRIFGVASGRPGSYRFTVVATDAAGRRASATLTLRIRR